VRRSIIPSHGLEMASVQDDVGREGMSEDLEFEFIRKTAPAPQEGC
jgi:hypothetical protein